MNPLDVEQGANLLRQSVKYEKQQMAREILATQKGICGLFDKEAALEILESTQNSNIKTNTSQDSTIDPKVNEAYSIYRKLRPDAPSFFEEHAFVHMQREMARLLSSGDKKGVNLTEIVNAPPQFSSDALALAMITLFESITSDLREFATLLGLLEDGEKLSFDQVYQSMTKSLKLARDGSNVDEWLSGAASKFLKLFASQKLSDIDQESVKEWLVDHLSRVRENYKLLDYTPKSPWYDFTRDFCNDGLVLPDEFEEEKKTKYPIDKAMHYMQQFLSLVKDDYIDENTFKMMDKLLKSLQGLGLGEWFKLKPNEIESTLFGTSDNSTSSTSGLPKIDVFQAHTRASANLILRLTSRGLEHLMLEHTLSPRAFLGDVVGIDIEATLRTTAESELLPDTRLNQMLSDALANYNAIPFQDAVTPLAQLISSEARFQENIGATELVNGQRRWKFPAGAVHDPKRNALVRLSSGADSKMRLDKLLCCLVERRRMRTMTREGRVYFVRVVVGVGDGNGYFGMGIGFGNDVSGAKSQAVQVAMQNMYFIDFDPKECLTTPVIGREYGVRIVISPRPLGKGIDVNKKWLPLMYLTGLDNCRVRFYGKKSWITRMRALEQALQSIYSRRTACNSTGQRYISIANPGDHTIHWPDAWFIPIANEYRQKMHEIKSRRIKQFKSAVQRRTATLLPDDLDTRPPRYAASKIKGTLETLAQEMRTKSYIETNIHKTQ